MFRIFVQMYIPNNLHTLASNQKQNMPYIKNTLKLIELLLTYHDKELANWLKSKKLVIEAYATPWVTTLFSRVVKDTALVYELWEIFLYERDRYFLFYFAVAMMITSRSQILSMKSFEKLLLTMTELRICSFEELSEIYKLAI